jgi:hypothetical protein
MDDKPQRTHFADDATLERMVRLEAALREAREALKNANATMKFYRHGVPLIKVDSALATIDEVLDHE